MALSTALSQQFNPQDLEILDRVYALAPLQLVARDLCSTKEEDPEEIAALRKQVFALAGSGPVNFDALSDKVLTTLVTRVNPIVWQPEPSMRERRLLRWSSLVQNLEEKGLRRFEIAASACLKTDVRHGIWHVCQLPSADVSCLPARPPGASPSGVPFSSGDKSDPPRIDCFETSARWDGKNP